MLVSDVMVIIISLYSVIFLDSATMWQFNILSSDWKLRCNMKKNNLFELNLLYFITCTINIKVLY